SQGWWTSSHPMTTNNDPDSSTRSYLSRPSIRSSPGSISGSRGECRSTNLPNWNERLLGVLNSNCATRSVIGNSSPSFQRPGSIPCGSGAERHDHQPAHAGGESEARVTLFRVAGLVVCCIYHREPLGGKVPWGSRGGGLSVW